MTLLPPSDRRASAPAIIEPDAHGQAALLLTESLLHAVVAKALLTNREAVDVVRIAAEVKEEVATAAGESERRMRESIVLLDRMAASFEADSGK